MSSAMIRPRLAFGLIMAAASLSACGRKSDSDAAFSVPLSSTSARPEDQFGKEFGKAFRADSNSEPAKVAESDMRPVSLTTEPVQIE